MSADFSSVTPAHVRRACRRAIKDGVPTGRQSRSTFLVFDGQRLPAKYVLGLAYELAMGKRLGPDEYTGGPVSGSVLSRLGFHVQRALPTPRSLVVATACVAGRPAESTGENPGRIRLLASVAEEIDHRRWLPTVLLFPGGYFHLPVHVGPREHAERVRHLASQPFSEACRQTARALDATVVGGVDSIPWLRRTLCSEDAGDQLCVAWDGTSIVGIGRKVFPTDGEADDLAVYASDMAAPQRLVALGPGRRALLCSCYDMFGCTETAEEPGTRSRNIRRLCTDHAELLRRRNHHRQLVSAVSDGLRAWEALVKDASIGLAAIHGFTRTGQGSGKAYWQRHGIERASQVLGGRMAFGAAHLEPPLPGPEVAVFAAKNGRRMSPVDHFVVSGPDGQTARLRLFRP